MTTLEKEKQSGVCFISRIPPKMQVIRLKELLDAYGIERVYLKPKQVEDQQNNKQKNQFSSQQKRRGYTEGWVEFTDKRVAKMTALSLHGTLMSQKKNSQFSDDLWQIKYLPNFKWEDLNDNFRYEQKTHADKVRIEMHQAKKVHDFYQERFDESKTKKKVKRE